MGTDQARLLQAIPEAIKKLYRLNHSIDIDVFPAWTSDLLTAEKPQQVSAVKRKTPEAYVLESVAA